jgi:hypothetical protein
MSRRAGSRVGLFSAWQNSLTYFSGAGAITLGGTVLIAWHAGSEAFLRMVPASAAMVFNTAVAFILAGSALVSILLGRPRPALVCGAVVLALGLLSGLQDLFGLDLGIDQLLKAQDLKDGVPHPGRMTPNIAVCSALTGAAIICMSSFPRSRWSPLLIGMLGSVTASISTNALFGYLVGVRVAYGWGGLVAMSFPAALGFTALGTGLIAYAWRIGTTAGSSLPRWFPVLTGVAVGTFTLGQWQALVVGEETHLERTVAREAQEVKRQVLSRLASFDLQMARISRRWGRSLQPSLDEWESEMRFCLEQDVGYSAFGWVAQSFHLRSVVPALGNEPLRNLDLSTQPAYGSYLVRARLERRTVLAPSTGLLTGEPGVLLFAPIFPEGWFGGWIVAAVRQTDLERACLDTRPKPDEYLVSVHVNGEAGGPGHDPGEAGQARWPVQVHFQALGVPFKVSISPSQRLVDQSGSLLPQVVLASGLAMALLLAVAVHLFQSARVSSRRLRDLYNRAPCGYHSLDEDGVFVEINDTELRWLRYSREEVVGRMKFSSLLSPGSQDKLDRRHPRLGEASVRELEYELVRKDGSLLPILLNAAVTRDEHSGSLHLRSTIFDITERKQMEEALRQSEERWSRVVETIAEGIFIINKDGRISFANATAEQITGISREAMYRRTHDDPAWKISTAEGNEFPSGDLPFARAMREGKPIFGTEVAFECGDGRRSIVSVNAAPLRDVSGGITGVVVSAVDVTKRKEVEHLKDEFISTVSHELRTPLTSLRGFAELMLSRDFKPETQREFLSIIHRESVRLTNLINDFLDIQRMESGRQNYAFRAEDLAEIVEETTAIFRGAETPDRIHLEVPHELPPIWVDADRIRQVLQNLIANAIKFSPKDRPITVAACREGERVVVRIRDQGMGIAAQDLPKLFGKFFRADNQETRTIGGTGLGLALVREIVKGHGGDVWVESEFGKGSTFFFSLPVAQVQPRASPLARTGTDQVDVLITEDDPSFCRLLTEHFRVEGLSVITTSSAEEALEIVKASPPRLAIVDIHLAGLLDGWDFMLKVKSDPNLRSIPILIISASDTVNAKGLAVAGGDYILKPVSPGWLLQAVRAQLPPMSSKRVLIADDDPLFRRHVMECLTADPDLQVDVAGSGKEALDQMEKRWPDLLLLDLLMPEMDGFAVLQQLRLDKRAANLPVLVITGKDMSIEDRNHIKRRLATLVSKREASLDHIARVAEQILEKSTVDG